MTGAGCSTGLAVTGTGSKIAPWSVRIGWKLPKSLKSGTGLCTGAGEAAIGLGGGGGVSTTGLL